MSTLGIIYPVIDTQTPRYSFATPFSLTCGTSQRIRRKRTYHTSATEKALLTFFCSRSARFHQDLGFTRSPRFSVMLTKFLRLCAVWRSVACFISGSILGQCLGWSGGPVLVTQYCIVQHYDIFIVHTFFGRVASFARMLFVLVVDWTSTKLIW